MSDENIPLRDLAPSEVGELDLYQKRERIYTRHVEGFFQRIRLYTGWPLLLLYFSLPWFEIHGRQAVWFDLPERKFHIFALTFWPQDFPLLAWLLIIAAYGLFTITVFAGRAWCGYTCPQTVWTSIFMWAEQVAEGTRNQRIRLDKGPWTANKIVRKSLKHAMWFGFAAWTGFTFIGYFTPIRLLLPDLLTLQAGAWASAWTLFFTLATYINAGWMREQLCIYACPYARFQSVMFDSDTLIVSYDRQRGEPRGARKRSADPVAQGLGDCIDCQLCVQVCPTGIDIRNGLQYQCITCALCIDACDSVMDKMGYARGLVSYTTENALTGKPSHVLRPRLIGYSIAIVLMCALFATVLLNRDTVGLDVLRERGTLFREMNGVIENVYTLKIRNMSESDRAYELAIEGLDRAEWVGPQTLRLRGGEVFAQPVRLRVPRQDIASALAKIVFTVQDRNDPSARATIESRFMAPAPPAR